MSMSVLVQDYGPLKRGDKNDRVKALQESLGIMQDGVFGPQTEKAVKQFQKDRGLKPDGIVGPVTAENLDYFTRSGIEPAIEHPPGRKPSAKLLSSFEEGLRALWPKASKRLVDGMIEEAPEVFASADINTPLRLAHLMAQLSHESGGGTVMEENLNYSAQRMTEVWPSRFKTAHDALPYSHNPEALANNVYGGRMGNEPGTTDGWDYRGRGLIQITGRENYDKVGARAGLDLIKHPELATNPKTALGTAGGYWQWKALNEYADRDEIRPITKKINGGYTGLDERENWLRRWKDALGA